MKLVEYALTRTDIFEILNDKGNIEFLAPELTSRYIVCKRSAEGFLTEYSSIYADAAGRGVFEMPTEFVVEESIRLSFMLVEGI